jgi:hypothetical protein
MSKQFYYSDASEDGTRLELSPEVGDQVVRIKVSREDSEILFDLDVRDVNDFIRDLRYTRTEALNP